MELGGADAFVVLKDADLKKTIDWAVFGRHWNGGQVCVSSKRMIVVDEVYDAFLDGYRKGVARLIAGDPFDPKTTLAPLSSQKAADDIKEQIRKAVSYGAKAEEVGLPVPNQGAFVQPTILTDVGEANPARYWEFFGPVSMLFRARDEDDAVRIANDSPFGLGGSVFTADEQHGFKVAKRISTGMVFVNHPTKVEADLPFGGIRRSGYGRELLGLGLKEFVNHKLIDVVDIEAHFRRHPYTAAAGAFGRCTTHPRRKLMALNEKVILVTGAAQGIGRGIALRLAADGADIALVDLKADKLEAVKRKLKRSVARRAPSPPTSASGITSMRPSTMPKRNSAASM